MIRMNPAGNGSAQHKAEDSLIVSGLSVAYGRRVVLRNVSAEISRGQAVGVVGPNGGGKSTLLKAIAGIIPTLGGSVTLFGKPIAGQRSRVAFTERRAVWRYGDQMLWPRPRPLSTGRGGSCGETRAQWCQPSVRP